MKLYILDKDKKIIYSEMYLREEYVKGAAEALLALHNAGFLLPNKVYVIGEESAIAFKHIVISIGD